MTALRKCFRFVSEKVFAIIFAIFNTFCLFFMYIKKKIPFVKVSSIIFLPLMILFISVNLRHYRLVRFLFYQAFKFSNALSA